MKGASRLAVLALAAILAVVPSRASADDPAEPAMEPAMEPAKDPLAKFVGADEWTKALASDDLAARRDAVYKMWSASDRLTVPHGVALAAALADVDGYVRDVAWKTLERMKAAAKPAVPTIAALLSSPREEVRAAAGGLLCKLGALSADVVPVLTKALDSEDAHVRELAASALGNAGKAAAPAREALTRLLDDDVPEVRTQAVGAIVAIDPIAAFSHPLVAVRLEAIGRLQNPGTVTPTSADALLAALSDESRDVRAGAAYALGTSMLAKDATWRDRAADAMLALWAKEAIPAVRSGFAYALGRAPSRADVSVPLLLEAAKAMDFDLKSMAMSALIELGPAAKAAVPHYLPILVDAARPPKDRASAAYLLGFVGEGDPAVVSALVAALEDPEPKIETAAALALGRFKVPGTLDRLVALAIDAKADVVARTQAAFSIATFGDAAKSALPAFEKATTDEPNGPPALSFVVLMLSTEPPKSAKDRLVAFALGDDLERRQRTGAVLVQARASPGAERWLKDLAPAFLEGLASKDAKVRARAADVIQWFPAATESATPILRRLAKDDPDADVRKAAANALITLGG